MIILASSSFAGVMRYEMSASIAYAALTKKMGGLCIILVDGHHALPSTDP